MKKSGIQTRFEGAAVRPLPKKFYDPRQTMSFLDRVKLFYERRPKRYEVQLEVMYSIPYSVTACSAKEASDYVRDRWNEGEYLSSDDIVYTAITTFRNGAVEKDVIL